MNRLKKLGYDTSLYAVAQFASAGLQLLALPIYTRHFSPAIFGTWDLILALMTMLVPLISLELSSATYRWLLDKQAGESPETIIATGWQQIIKNMISFSIIASLVSLLFKLPYKWEIIILINLLIILQFFQQAARGLERNKLFALLLFLPTAITISLVMASIFYFPLGIHAFLYGQIISLTLTIILAYKRLAFQQYNSTVASRQLLKKYLTYAVPIIPAAISWIIMTMMDRLVIAFFLGVEANGIYAVALKIPAILLIFNTIFSLAWKDNVLRFFHQEASSKFFVKVYSYYVLALAIILIVLIVSSKPLITFAIGPAYKTAWKYSIILLLAVFFQALALFWSSIFHGTKQTGIILYSTMIGLISNLLLNLALVKTLGLYGVALASMIAFFLMWIVREIAGRKTMKKT